MPRRMRSYRLFPALLVAVLASPALAQAAEPEVEFELGVASEYIGKGIGKSAGDPSVFGSAEIAVNGFYASVFASTAELKQGSDSEIVSAVGHRSEVGGFELDVSLVNRELPGARLGVDENYFEYQADISRKLGPVSTRLRINYSPDGFAATQEAWWIELQGGVALDGRTKLTAAVADRSADGGAEYVAWNAGVKRKLTDDLTLDVRWFDTDGHAFGEAYEGRLVGVLTVSF